MFDNCFMDMKSKNEICGFIFECYKDDANFFALDSAGKPLMYNNGNPVEFLLK